MEPIAIQEVPDTNKNKEEQEQNYESDTCNVVGELSEQLVKISFGEPRDATFQAHVSQLTRLSQLKNELPCLCNEVFNVLGPYNLEATYQRALARELEARGVTVLSEVAIPIHYKGQRIASRRVDLYLKLEHPVILELKAVGTGLKTEHLKQLHYYLTHFNVSEGYLINFPHRTGFPLETPVQYINHVVQSSTDGIGMSDRVTRSSNTLGKNMRPTIIHVQKLQTKTRRVEKKSTIKDT
ncbi:unnamed protein product [Peronospora belbahrii]|uniref:GxxExxY protein n=1 Tax=Peronospora belbahrii TaxID=622444 RepID=A0ABN8CVK7_9STRA|nr:unnamed protein product [Peronospora belbahrii]